MIACHLYLTVQCKPLFRPSGRGRDKLTGNSCHRTYKMTRVMDWDFYAVCSEWTSSKRNLLMNFNNQTRSECWSNQDICWQFTAWKNTSVPLMCHDHRLHLSGIDHWDAVSFGEIIIDWTFVTLNVTNNLIPIIHFRSIHCSIVGQHFSKGCPGCWIPTEWGIGQMWKL